MNCLRGATFLVLSTTLSISMCGALAADTVSSESVTTEKTTEIGAPTVIQHVDSKMEPIAVQSFQRKNPTTGETSTVVQPIIMERHDKVLDTTIVQPEVTETKTVREDVTQNKQLSAPAHKVVAKSHTCIRKPHKTHVVTKHTSVAPAGVTTQSSKVDVVETVTRQTGIKETTIKAPPANPAPAPQVIEKTEQ